MPVVEKIGRAPDLKDSVVAKLVDERHAAWQANLPLGDDAALWHSLTVLGQKSLLAHFASTAGFDPSQPRSLFSIVIFQVVHESYDVVPAAVGDEVQVIAEVDPWASCPRRQRCLNPGLKSVRRFCCPGSCANAVVGTTTFQGLTHRVEPYGPPATSRNSFTRATLMK